MNVRKCAFGTTLLGRTFGSVGAYEELRGKAYGEADPRDPRNLQETRLRRLK